MSDLLNLNMVGLFVFYFMISQVCSVQIWRIISLNIDKFMTRVIVLSELIKNRSLIILTNCIHSIKLNVIKMCKPYRVRRAQLSLSG